MTYLVAAVFALIGLVLYAAVINGAFKRCPHCGKIGSWRYDPLGPPVEEKDADGALVGSKQTLCCRGCQGRVVETWSDFEGRRFEKE